MACHDQMRFVGLASTTCPNTFTSGHAENHPAPKSGRDLDPGSHNVKQPVREVKLTPFCRSFFLDFCSQSPTQLTYHKMYGRGRLLHCQL